MGDKWKIAGDIRHPISKNWRRKNGKMQNLKFGKCARCTKSSRCYESSYWQLRHRQWLELCFITNLSTNYYSALTVCSRKGNIAEFLRSSQHFTFCTYKCTRCTILHLPVLQLVIGALFFFLIDLIEKPIYVPVRNIRSSCTKLSVIEPIRNQSVTQDVFLTTQYKMPLAYYKWGTQLEPT